MYSLIVLEARSKNQGVGRAMLPWKALGENHSWPHFWWLWGFLALWLPHSTDRPLSSVSSFLVPIRTPLTGFRTSLCSPRVISNQYRQYLSRCNLITDVSVIFFQIRPHSQVPTIKSWTYFWEANIQPFQAELGVSSLEMTKGSALCRPCLCILKSWALGAGTCGLTFWV